MAMHTDHRQCAQCDQCEDDGLSYSVQERHHPLASDHVDVIADRAAKKAVSDMLFMLGYDVHSAKDVERFRRSLRAADRLSEATERGFLYFMAAGLTAISVAAWYAIAKHFPGGT